MQELVSWTLMTDYYYYSDPESVTGHQAVPVDDVVAAMRRIAKKERLEFSDADILRELGIGENTSGPRKKAKSRRISLYIDGTNLFAGQYDLFGPKQVLSFRSLLGDIKKHYPVSRVFFYASYTPRKPKRRPAAFFASEAIFYRDVRSIPGLVFYKGHRSPTSGKEKGVDIHLALDMVGDAFTKQYDEAVIMTGDADLIYAVEIVKRLGYPIHAVFLVNRFSLELAYKATSGVVLDYTGSFTPNRKLPHQLKRVVIKKPRLQASGVGEVFIP